MPWAKQTVRVSCAVFLTRFHLAPWNSGTRIRAVNLESTIELFGLRFSDRQSLRLVREAFPKLVIELYSLGRSKVAEVERRFAHNQGLYIICRAV